MAKETIDLEFVYEDTPMKVGIAGRHGYIAFNTNHRHSRKHNYKGFGFTLETIDHAIRHLGSVKKALEHKMKTLQKEEPEKKPHSKSEAKRLAIMKEASERKK